MKQTAGPSAVEIPASPRGAVDFTLVLDTAALVLHDVLAVARSRRRSLTVCYSCNPSCASADSPGHFTQSPSSVHLLLASAHSKTIWDNHSDPPTSLHTSISTTSSSTTTMSWFSNLFTGSKNTRTSGRTAMSSTLDAFSLPTSSPGYPMDGFQGGSPLSPTVPTSSGSYSYPPQSPTGSYDYVPTGYVLFSDVIVSARSPCLDASPCHHSHLARSLQLESTSTVIIATSTPNWIDEGSLPAVVGDVEQITCVAVERVP